MKNRMIFFCLVFCLAMSMLSGVSCVKMPAAGAEKATGKMVSGIVTTTGGVTAPSERVFLFKAEPNEPLRSAATDFLGRYRFVGLAPGQYMIQCVGVQQAFKIEDGDLKINMVIPGDAEKWTNIVPGKPPEVKLTPKKLEPKKEQESKDEASQTKKPVVISPAEKLGGIWTGFTSKGGFKMSLCPKNAYTEQYNRPADTLQPDQKHAGPKTINTEVTRYGFWSIQGNSFQGTISVEYEDGSQRTIQYRTGEVEDCIYFGDDEFCRIAPKCTK